MWTFKRRGTEVDPEAILGSCNFEFARRKLADFFRIMEEEAASRGVHHAVREDFLRGWERFAENPCLETATAWLKEAPDCRSLLLDHFAKCCPGGHFALIENPYPSLSEMERKTEEAMELISKMEQHPWPIRYLAGAIVGTSGTLAEGLKRQMKFPTEKEKIESWLAVECEFIYFFLHLMSRAALAALGDERRVKLIEKVGPLVINPVVVALFAHLPEDLQSSLVKSCTSSCFEELNKADVEYGKCRALLVEHDYDLFSEHSLFTRLANRVAKYLGSPVNPAVIALVRHVSIQTFIKMNLLELVKAAG